MMTTTMETTTHKIPLNNAGCAILANNQRITNRTKYYLIGWHWFWSHVHPRGPFRVQKVDTRLQQADFLSKPLTRELFENNRGLVQGW